MSRGQTDGSGWHPLLLTRNSVPAPYLPLDGCRHLVALLHDAFEDWVAQAWERHGNSQGAEEAPNDTWLKTTRDK